MKRVNVSWVSGALAVGMLMPARMTAQRTVAEGATVEDRRAVDRLLARRITIDLTRVSRRSAINVIAEKSGVPIQYGVATLDAYTGVVSIHATDLPLGVVLERVLQGTSLRVVPDQNAHLMIVDAASGTDSVPTTGTIVGRATDSASGRALEGVTVNVEALGKRRAVTDHRGQFTLTGVPAGHRIVTFKLFGYRPSMISVDVSAGERQSVVVPMTGAPNILTGVITTATGVQDRRTIGNDITVIDADSVMRMAPVRNVTDLLETRVPGLVVTHTSGVPGAPSRLRLRGIGGGLIRGAANTNNDPIVVVDGVRVYARQSTERDQNTASPGSYAAPSAIDQIDPNSIDKIEVFKGPSASALYGSEAANGVIVITTKRGRAGPARVTSALEYGLEYLPGVYAPPTLFVFGHNAADGRSDLCDIINQGSCSQRDSVVAFQALNAPRLSPFGTGQRSGASLTVGGGTTTIQYSLTGSVDGSVGYLRMPSFYRDQFADLYGRPVDQWMKRPNMYRSWGANGSMSFQPRPSLVLTIMPSLLKSVQRQSSVQLQLATLSTTYIDTSVIIPSTVGAYATRVTSQSLSANYIADATWRVREMLTVKLTGGLNTIDRLDQTLTPHGIVSSDEPFGDGNFSMGHPTSEVHTATATATYRPRQLLTVTAGLQLNQTSTSDFTASAQSLPEGVSTPATLTNAAQSTTALTTGGWFFEPRFDLGHGIFASPGFRLDGGSASGSQGGVHNGLFSLFPKLDFSWIAINREGERPLGGVITMLRPRLAFGVSGVQPNPEWKLRLSAIPGIESGRTSNGLLLTALGNVNLRPERSREIEGGFDAQLWGDRARFTASVARRTRFDAIQNVPVAPSIYGGTLSFYMNIGRIRNTDVELSGDVTLVETASLSWHVNASYTHNDNVLETINTEAQDIDFANRGSASDGIRFVAGYPINGRWARPILGYNIPPAGKLLSVNDIAVGDSLVYLGQESPKYLLPVGTSLSLWRGVVNLDAQFDFQDGLTQFNSGSASALTSLAVNPKATLGQQAAALAALCESSTALLQGCAAIGTPYGMIQTVSVLRFKSASITYQVPRTLSRRLGIPTMSVSLQGSNLGLWTNYRGKDPSVNTIGVGEGVQDTGIPPEPRAWILRCSLGN